MIFDRKLDLVSTFGKWEVKCEILNTFQNSQKKQNKFREELLRKIRFRQNQFNFFLSEQGKLMNLCLSIRCISITNRKNNHLLE